MNATEMRFRPARSDARTAASPLDRIAREALLRALAALQSGQVQVEDAGGRHLLGTSDPDAPLRAGIRVHHPRFYRLVAMQGALGAAESYRQGDWDADDLTTLFRVFVRRVGQESAGERRLAWLFTLGAYLTHLLRGNGRAGARRNIEAHYDLGNDFFALFLDPTLTYSCGVFESPSVSLQQASETKLRMVCDKLGLRPDHHVLEIGSGWGSFAILAAREYGCRVTTVTLSRRQQEEAATRIRQAGLSERVSVRLQDYRDVGGQFDRIVSIEMIEAVGHARLGQFFAKCSELLRPDGAMAMQSITMPDQGYEAYLRRTDFIRHYIFPGGSCPSRTALLTAATRRSDLRLTHLEEIGDHYALTLKRWRMAFVERYDEARALGYPEEFLRLWHFYLCYSEAGFLERHVGDVQLVFAKPSYTERHRPARVRPWSCVVPANEAAHEEGYQDD
jgi:cyclopropane-fatty-acyl-phospholipid synthase